MISDHIIAQTQNSPSGHVKSPNAHIYFALSLTDQSPALTLPSLKLRHDKVILFDNKKESFLSIKRVINTND